jgi:hypothetical protein
VVRKVVANPLRSIRQYTHIPEARLLTAKLDIASELFFGLAFGPVSPQVTFDFDYGGADLHVNPTPVAHCRLKGHNREVLFLQLKRRRQNELTRIRLDLGFCPAVVAPD